VHAGQALEFSGTELHAGDVIELIDPGGRRVASVTANASGRAQLERSQTSALEPGLYFANVRGRDARGRVVVLR
jgi:hypothetical protein